jgi:hypothetical protein
MTQKSTTRAAGGQTITMSVVVVVVCRTDVLLFSCVCVLFVEEDGGIYI